MKKAFSYLREGLGWVPLRISSEGFFLVFFCLQKVHLIFSLEQKLQHHHHHHHIILITDDNNFSSFLVKSETNPFNSRVRT